MAKRSGSKRGKQPSRNRPSKSTKRDKRKSGNGGSKPGPKKGSKNRK